MPKRNWTVREEKQEEPDLIPDIYVSGDESDVLSAPSESENEAGMESLELNFLAQKYGMGFKPPINPVYDSDDSDIETENTVGNIPLKWYDEFEHIGYDRAGKKIAKPATQDELDKFLANTDNPDIWRTVFDEAEGRNVTLTREDLEIIKRIEQGQVPDPDFNPYQDTIEYFTSQTEIMPLSAAPEPKRRFIPSKTEARKVRIVLKWWAN